MFVASFSPLKASLCSDILKRCTSSTLGPYANAQIFVYFPTFMDGRDQYTAIFTSERTGDRYFV